MQIGEAARRAGTSVRVLRHYEQEGLIVPGRCANGYRDFCESTVSTARTVAVLVGAGWPTRLIRALLPFLGEAGFLTAEAPCDQLVAELTRHRNRLDERLRALTASRDALTAYLNEISTPEPGPPRLTLPQA